MQTGVMEETVAAPVDHWEAARRRYDELGITQEMERAVIDHLTALGAMQNCYGPDGRCNGDCPQGQHCTEAMRGNCVCVRDKQ